VAVEIFDSTNEGVARSYVLTGCSIDRSNGGADTVTCTTPEGVGGPFAAAVTITTPYSTGTEICETPKNFAATMVYASPTIDSDGISGDDAMSTGGGSEVTFQGSNFGPIGTIVTASYANDDYSYTTGNCEFVTAHTEVTCTTGPGVGSGFKWRLNVQGLQSDESTQESSYLPPSVGNVQLREFGGVFKARDTMDTRGIDQIDISGSNFGGFTVETPTVHYGTDGSDGTVDMFAAGTAYEATACIAVVSDVNNGHTYIRCQASAGVGQNLV
jgi:hypothetical protein